MCYVGKATKIFIFIVTVLVVTGLLLGFGLLRHGIGNSHKCSGDPSSSCHQSQMSFPSPNPNPNPNPNPSSMFNQPPLPPPPPAVVETAAPSPTFSPPSPFVSLSPFVTPSPVQS
ncbi:hypothetical protein ACSBR2_012138 [Camellia fascicularis]